MKRDPWFFQRWAFEQRVGNPIRKGVLSMLAMMADASTGRCEAKQDTIAYGVECKERAVRGHLKALEDRGLIARRPQFRVDRGRRGDEFLLLAPGIIEWPDGQLVHAAPDAGGIGAPVPHPAAPGAGQELPPQSNHAQQQGGEARADAQQIPADFPEELRPHARLILPLLRSVAQQHRAKAVTPLALGRLMAAPTRRHKPFVRAAHDFAAWAANPPRPPRDVVASYRTWLDREPDLAGVEALTATAVGYATGGNVTALHPRRDPEAERRDRQARRAAVARGDAS